MLEGPGDTEVLSQSHLGNSRESGRALSSPIYWQIVSMPGTSIFSKI